ncbi:unnamed protein product [Bursaphelenchus okinawaensis]|uniref:Uncharacterized protein n=1 Tax=Bursaphelenchus okinawaensis TaxID=465554 RepID=A0A811KBM3_9BILA|nr:unnamed protein product [Bursaphelenchus okinawaensis]CAG9099509.1 unnamed protein product [Bursaphelenchus okinawaensis]
MVHKKKNKAARLKRATTFFIEEKKFVLKERINHILQQVQRTLGRIEEDYLITNPYELAILVFELEEARDQIEDLEDDMRYNSLEDSLDVKLILENIDSKVESCKERLFSFVKLLLDWEKDCLELHRIKFQTDADKRYKFRTADDLPKLVEVLEYSKKNLADLSETCKAWTKFRPRCLVRRIALQHVKVQEEELFGIVQSMEFNMGKLKLAYNLSEAPKKRSSPDETRELTSERLSQYETGPVYQVTSEILQRYVNQLKEVTDINRHNKVGE